MLAIEQIIRKGVFGLHELRELSEHNPYFLNRLIISYGFDNKKLHSYVTNGDFTYDDFSKFLDMFINGEITENSNKPSSLAIKFACKLLSNEFKKILSKFGE